MLYVIIIIIIIIIIIDNWSKDLLLSTWSQISTLVWVLFLFLQTQLNALQ